MFPSQRASNDERVSITWRHHVGKGSGKVEESHICFSINWSATIWDNRILCGTVITRSCFFQITHNGHTSLSREGEVWIVRSTLVPTVLMCPISCCTGPCYIQSCSRYIATWLYLSSYVSLALIHQYEPDFRQNRSGKIQPLHLKWNAEDIVGRTKDWKPVSQYNSRSVLLQCLSSFYFMVDSRYSMKC